MRNDRVVTLLVLAALALAQFARPLPAAEAPQAGGHPVQPEPAKDEGATAAPEASVERRDSLLLTDQKNSYELRLPAPYWESKTREELDPPQATGGGCAPAQRMPPGLLLFLRNKDAELAIAYLQKMPDGFLMRNRSDLEKYVDDWKQLFKGEGGESVTFLESKYGERDNLITHRLVFTRQPPARTGPPGGCAPERAPARGAEKVAYTIADFFVRPADEDARLYRIICIASEEEAESASGEFETLIGSFRFTGQTAEEFFAPDAPEDKLPSLGAQTGAKGGGKSGSSWLMVAMLIVVVVYLMMRRRSRAREFSV